MVAILDEGKGCSEVAAETYRETVTFKDACVCLCVYVYADKLGEREGSPEVRKACLRDTCVFLPFPPDA